MAASIKLISPAGGSVTLTAPMTTDNFSFDIGGGTSLATLNVSNSLAVGANLNFTGTSQRITGDFTNTLIPSRVIFQTSNTNSSTGIYAVPSGSSTAASWQAANTADPTNASKILIATNGSTDVQLVSGVNGTGTYLPLTFYNGGSERMRLSNTGNFSIGTANTDTYKLNVNGSANISGTLTVNGSEVVAGLSGINNVATFTANTTWTVPTGVTKAKVTVIAGGGGGGSGGSNGQQYGKAGGFGGIAVGFVTGLTPGGTVAITVGAAGTGSTYGGTNSGSTPQQNGTAGGTSSFGSYITCTGGAVGTYQASAGGAATNGTTSGASVLYSLPLPPTTLASYTFRTTAFGISGISGSSGTGVAGTAGSGYGAPGGGGDVNSAYFIGQYAGGNGAPGLVILEY